MSVNNIPIKLLLEQNEELRRQVAACIQQEVLLPEYSADAPEFEMEDAYIPLPALTKDRKRKTRRKNPRWTRRKPGIFNEQKRAMLPKSNSNGISTSVNELIQNAEVRRQLAPYIQEEVILADCSDDSGEEETGSNIPSGFMANKVVNTGNASKQQISEPMLQVLLPDEDYDSEVIFEESPSKSTQKECQILGNDGHPLNVHIIDDNYLANIVIKETRGSYIESEDIVEEPTIIGKNDGLNKGKEPKKNKTAQKKRKSVTNNSKQNQVTASVEADAETSNDNSTSIMESDDWYYLNMAKEAEKLDRNAILHEDDDIIIIEDDEPQPSVRVPPSQVERRGIKVLLPKKDKPHVEPVQKVQLQGKIVRGGLKKSPTKSPIISHETRNTSELTISTKRPSSSNETRNTPELTISTKRPSTSNETRSTPELTISTKRPSTSNETRNTPELTISKKRPSTNNGVRNTSKAMKSPTTSNQTSNTLAAKKTIATPTAATPTVKTSTISSDDDDDDDDDDNYDEDVSSLIITECPSCQKTFGRKKGRRNCEFCGTLYAYHCLKCGKTYDNHCKVLVHIKRSHMTTERYVCRKCDRRFTYRADGLTHFKSCGLDARFTCELCTFKSKYKHNLATHIKTVHMGKSLNNRCENCDIEFGSMKDARKHLFNDCQNRKLHRCLECRYSSYDRDNVVVHIFQTHSRKETIKVPPHLTQKRCNAAKSRR